MESHSIILVRHFVLVEPWFFMKFFLQSRNFLKAEATKSLTDVMLWLCFRTRTCRRTSNLLRKVSHDMHAFRSKKPFPFVEACRDYVLIAEVIEYARWLGMDPENEEGLLWIAREGIKVHRSA